MAASAAAASTARSAASKSSGALEPTSRRRVARRWFRDQVRSQHGRRELRKVREDNVSDEVSPQTLKEGLNGVIFMGSFIVLSIGVGIWWLRRNA
jgi:hypothetical protein